MPDARAEARTCRTRSRSTRSSSTSHASSDRCSLARHSRPSGRRSASASTASRSRRDRRAAVAVGEAHQAAEHKPLLQEMHGGFGYVQARADADGADRARVPDDVPGLAADDVPAGLRAGCFPRRGRPLQPDAGVLRLRFGGRRTDRRVARTLQTHGHDAAGDGRRLRGAGGGFSMSRTLWVSEVLLFLAGVRS